MRSFVNEMEDRCKICYDVWNDSLVLVGKESKSGVELVDGFGEFKVAWGENQRKLPVLIEKAIKRNKDD